MALNLTQDIILDEIEEYRKRIRADGQRAQEDRVSPSVSARHRRLGFVLLVFILLFAQGMAGGGRRKGGRL